MNIQKDKVAFFERTLADFFGKAGRERLPWREPRAMALRGEKGIGAYEVWVSEIMLQQTQVSRVIGYYEKFLARFLTVESLAAASWETFLPYYQGLGYYARGRNMLLAAKMVVSEYGGIFPKEVNELDRLPGVGPYTAAAIASFAYGKNTIAWDTNLRRVVGRFFFGMKRADIPTEDYAKAFRMKAKTLNAAMMDFGSAICTARPKCGVCPLAEHCVYFSEDGKKEIRMKNKESSSKKSEAIDWKEAQAFVFLHKDHRVYYSPFKTKFAPFIIPPSHNTRAGIKDWFRDRYRLELAVRPPHRKVVVNGKPTLFVNAQILLGVPIFLVCSPAEKRRFDALVGDKGI